MFMHHVQSNREQSIYRSCFILDASTYSCDTSELVCVAAAPRPAMSFLCRAILDEYACEVRTPIENLLLHFMKH